MRQIEKHERMKEKEEPPFPHMAIALLCIGFLAHSVAFSSPSPYVAFMMVDFHMADNVDTAGYAAGWITGMFMVGRAVAGIPWGLAADRFGRKACLLVSMLNVMVFGILFGFSENFYMAVSFRLLLGLGNGFLGVAKTYVSEIVECKEHELRAFGYLNSIFGLGMIVGPAIGGTLARPAVQYPGLFSSGSIWGEYPYLLPSLAGSVFAAVAAAGIIFFVPETLIVRQDEGHEYSMVSQQDRGLGEMESGSGNEGIELSEYAGIIEAERRDYLQVVTHRPNSSYHESEDEGGFSSEDEEKLKVKTVESFKKSDKLPSSMHEILNSSIIQSIFFNYLSYCFVTIVYDESVPLNMVTSVNNGGLAWEAVDVGETLAIIGLGMVIYQLFFFEKCMTTFFKKGPKDTLAHTEALVGYTMPLYVITSWVLRWLLEHDPSLDTRRSILLRVVVIVTLLIYELPSVACYTQISMMVNASVDASMRGTVNGLMMTAGSLGDGIGPIVGSALYAWMVTLPYGSQSDNHQAALLPIDGRAVFLLCAVMCYLLSWFTRIKLANEEVTEE